MTGGVLVTSVTPEEIGQPKQTNLGVQTPLIDEVYDGTRPETQERLQG